jgi:N-acetylglucosamine kinase-like BadF-type ATPase
MTRHYVAIDGGNSKTDVVIGDDSGRLLAFRQGPGSSPHRLGLTGTMTLLDSLVRDAVAQAGISTAERAELYVAGADLPIEVEQLTAAVRAAGWAKDARVDNDLFALLRAGTSEGNAVAVVCGAGINCVGRRADGEVARFLSLGSISGDWGGGRHLANLALWHAARSEDGRGPATALAAAVASHFDRGSVAEVSIGLHLGDIGYGQLDGLAPIVFTVAAAGDPVARELVAKQAKEIVDMAVVAAGRLDLLDTDFAVVLGGGVLRARHALLQDDITARLLVAAPKARITVTEDLPVAGAALLALDAFGATTVAVEARVRTEISRAARLTA